MTAALVAAIVVSQSTSPASAGVAPQACDLPDANPGYTGQGGCRPGGELVTITQVMDGDEFRLADGRTVRLLGALAPALSECGGPEAAEYARQQVTGGWANLLTAGPADAQGRVRGHLQVNAGSVPGPTSVSESGVPYSLSSDLGYMLSMNGWARAASSTNPPYTATIIHNEAAARSAQLGQFGSLCAATEPLPPADTTAVPPSGGDVNVDVDHPHHRFCRHWWC